MPEDIKTVVQTRAAAAGQSSSDYALGALRRSAERPTTAELTARIRQRGGPVEDLTPTAAEILRVERDARRPSSTLRPG